MYPVIVYLDTHKLQYELQSADYIFINVYIINVENTVSYASPHHF